MTRFHFINGLLISTLALGAAACSSDKSSPGTADAGNTSAGGASSASGGSSASSGGASTGSGGASTGSGGANTGSGGASTGSGGASTGSGGASTGSGGASGTVSAGCASYCTANLANCKGANKQFDNADACDTACAKYPTTGKDGDTTGNTLQCRVYHTGAAATDPGTHCPHTGVTPTAYCL